jgi:hypothetical protein
VGCLSKLLHGSRNQDVSVSLLGLLVLMSLQKLKQQQQALLTQVLLPVVAHCWQRLTTTACGCSAAARLAIQLPVQSRGVLQQAAVSLWRNSKSSCCLQWPGLQQTPSVRAAAMEAFKWSR